MVDDCGERGATLLEVLVAFAILSLALGAIYQTIAHIAVGVDKVQLQRHVIAMADSKMNAISDPASELPIQSGVNRVPPYSWSLRIAPMVVELSELKSIRSQPYIIRYLAKSRSGAVLVDIKTIRNGSRIEPGK